MTMSATAAPTVTPAAERESRRARLHAALARVLPADSIQSDPEATAAYECDALSAYRVKPLIVVLPRTEEEVARVLATCHAQGAPVVARGGGTGLSGGALPHTDGVTLSLARLNRVLEVDPVACTATVQCGVRNLAISDAAAPIPEGGGESGFCHLSRSCGREMLKIKSPKPLRRMRRISSKSFVTSGAWRFLAKAT